MSGGTVERPGYLIVDDSPLSLKWLARILQGIGPCEVVEATDGVVAVEKLASVGERIDAVISDLRMPNMNGLELLKEVRLGKTGAVQNIPFFIVTGISERALAGLALSLDVDAFLARPPKQQALSRHLARARAERRVAKTPVEALETYGNVDLTLAALPANDAAAQPAEPSPPPASPSLPPVQTEAGRETAEATRLQAVAGVPHIAVVDDERDLRGAIAEYLTGRGFRVSVADGGASLRRLIAEGNDFDLVLLDVQMPGEDGLSVARWLREHARAGVIMLTASVDTIDRVTGLEVGADDYVGKPFDFRELLARVRSVLRRVDRPAVKPANGTVAAPPPEALVQRTPTAMKNGSAVAFGERLVALEDVPKGALLARDAVNGAGAVLVKAGEELTSSLKAVLISYAEIDESLARIWVQGSAA